MVEKKMTGQYWLSSVKICQSAKSYFLFQGLCKERVNIDDDKHSRIIKEWKYEYLK